MGIESKSVLIEIHRTKESQGFMSFLNDSLAQNDPLNHIVLSSLITPSCKGSLSGSYLNRG